MKGENINYPSETNLDLYILPRKTVILDARRRGIKFGVRKNRITFLEAVYLNIGHVTKGHLHIRSNIVPRLPLILAE